MFARGDDDNDGTGSGGVVDGGNSERLEAPRIAVMGEPSTPMNQAGGYFEAGAAAMPQNLANVLREELDVSCRLGCHEAGQLGERKEDNESFGGQEAKRGGSSAGLCETDE